MSAISRKIKKKDDGAKYALSQSIPSGDLSIDWFTKDGYYITSTAYLIASAFSWIQLYERDVAFLRFGKISLTRDFYRLIERLKASFSRDESILWYHYVGGIGEKLIDRDANRPMFLSEFTKKLYRDKDFRGYYDQLFVFLNQVASGEHLERNMDFAVKTLKKINSFLEENGVVIVSA